MDNLGRDEHVQRSGCRCELEELKGKLGWRGDEWQK